MSNTPTSVNLYGVGVGTAPNATMVPVVANYSPAATNLIGPNGPYMIGQKWVNKASNLTYTLTSVSPSSGATWTLEGQGTGAVTSVSGTTNQITATPSTGDVVLALAAPMTTPGAVSVTGNLTLNTAGNKLNITTGTNASAGKSAAMTAGTITISTTAVTSSSLIFLTNAVVGGTPGILSVGTIVNGTSFVINSSSATDTSQVNWLIIN